jgi:hypothetical protein
VPVHLQLSDALRAFCADLLSVELLQVPGRATEQAVRLILAQNDRIALHADFHAVVFRKIETATHLDRQNDPSQLV